MEDQLSPEHPSPRPSGNSTGRGLPRGDHVDAFGIDFINPPRLGHSPLPEATEEANAIATAFDGDPILNAEVTRERVWLGRRQARYVHFATHGSLDVEAPSFQSISLNAGRSDSAIRALDILYLDLRGLQLVTLGACETALGRFDSLDNIRGLPANLLLAGVQTIVGTLWSVESTTSRDFFLILSAAEKGPAPVERLPRGTTADAYRSPRIPTDPLLIQCKPDRAVRPAARYQKALGSSRPDARRRAASAIKVSLLLRANAS